MMNPITKALDEVKFKIPRYILEQVFNDNLYGWKSAPTSIDDSMLSLVIRPRVLVDCNLVGGAEIFVYLEGLESQLVNPYTIIYRIPKERTQGRSIIAPLSVYNYLGGMITAPGINTPYITNDTIMAGNAMMNALKAAPAISTAYIQLIGENTIMVRENARLTGINYLRCVVANDENMNHLQLRSYPAFSKLVTLAIKSYIYNTLVIKMDTAFLQGGQELGRFKEIVDEYADAEELYQTYLEEEWQGVAFMNDNESYTRFLKLNVGGMK